MRADANATASAGSVVTQKVVPASRHSRDSGCAAAFGDSTGVASWTRQRIKVSTPMFFELENQFLVLIEAVCTKAGVLLNMFDIRFYRAGKRIMGNLAKLLILSIDLKINQAVIFLLQLPASICERRNSILRVAQPIQHVINCGLELQPGLSVKLSADGFDGFAARLNGREGPIEHGEAGGDFCNDHDGDPSPLCVQNRHDLATDT